MVIDINWQAELSAAEVWQREAVILEIQASGSGLSEFAHLVTENVRIPGMDVVPLPEQNSQQGRNEQQRSLSLRWKLIPHKSGRQQINLKKVYYSLNGGKQKNWQPPPLEIEIRPLPPYLPPTFPVGELSMHSSYEYSGWLSPGEVAIWHLSIQSDGVSQAQFPDVVRQIRSSQDLHILPAQVSMKTTEAGRFIMDYTIPLKAKSAGRLDIPAIDWQWFDPQTSKLQRDSYHVPRPWVLYAWQRMVLGTVVLLLLLLLARRLYLFGHGRLQRKHSRQQFINAVNNKTAVREAMNDCAAAHNWPSNLGIRQWLAHWQIHYGKDAELEEALFAYEKEYFGN